MAKEYKNKLAVAGMKATNRIKRINQGLPAALLIHPSHDQDPRAKGALPWMAKAGYTVRGKSARPGAQSLAGFVVMGKATGRGIKWDVD
jgi:hypothetical protein